MSETTVRASCDECSWSASSSLAAKRHHEQTGHATWAETFTRTFYGDPITAWARENGIEVIEVADSHPGGTGR